LDGLRGGGPRRDEKAREERWGNLCWKTYRHGTSGGRNNNRRKKGWMLGTIKETCSSRKRRRAAKGDNVG